MERYKGKPNNSEKICPSATLSIRNPTSTNPGANPGLHHERPTTNRLNHASKFVVHIDGVRLCLRTTTCKEPIVYKVKAVPLHATKLGGEEV
jgi:hypothetical protein